MDDSVGKAEGVGVEGRLGGRRKGWKIWDNCNSIKNKI